MSRINYFCLMLANITCGKNVRRKKCVSYDLKNICVRGLRKVAKDIGTWKLILKDARVLHGP
jgi:hypothetical protein